MIIFFDVDSTLVENRFSRRALTEVLAELENVSGKSVRELAQEMWNENDRRQQTDPDHVLTMDWDDIVLSLATRYQVTLKKNPIELWNTYASASEVEIIDDAPSMLAALKAKGHTLVVATKGLWKYQEPVLRVTGLLPYFDDILTPDRTGFLKTTAAYFQRYTKAGGRFVQVGDHYFDDVIVGRRNGFTTIWRAPNANLQHALSDYDPFERPAHISAVTQFIPTYPKDGTEIVPDVVVVSLQEVPAVIARLEVLANNL